MPAVTDNVAPDIFRNKVVKIVKNTVYRMSIKFKNLGSWEVVKAGMSRFAEEFLSGLSPSVYAKQGRKVSKPDINDAGHNKASLDKVLFACSILEPPN